jgi:hypothetical protein
MKNLEISKLFLNGDLGIYESNSGMPFGVTGKSEHFINRPVLNCLGNKIGTVSRDFQVIMFLHQILVLVVALLLQGNSELKYPGEILPDISLIF